LICLLDQEKSQQLTAKNIASFDCVVIGAKNDSFDYEMVLDNSVLIVDTRGVYCDEHEDIIRA